MGKHRYSSVDFNRVDWKGLSEDITGTVSFRQACVTMRNPADFLVD
jgi:hypothetical protein